MIDSLLVLVAAYGGLVLFLGTFFSCLAVPIPASLMMLAGGGFAASGDLDLAVVVVAAFAGAVSGDQTGYVIGRASGPRLQEWLKDKPRRAAFYERARSFAHRHGDAGVFLSRWLVSPLGPYVNFASGATGLRYARFVIWSAAGEAVWVLIYVGLGYSFAARIVELSEVLGNASGFAAAGVMTVIFGLWLRSALRNSNQGAR